MNTSPAFFAQPLIARLGWTLLHFLWQGALIAALYAAVRSLASRWMSPGARYALACVSLILMASAPILTYGFLASGSWRWNVPTASIPQMQVARSAVAIPPAPWYSLVLAGLERALPWLVTAWLLGVMVLLIRLVRGTFSAARLRSRGTRTATHPWIELFQRIAAQLGVARPVRLMISSVVEVPVVIGWFRPLVLLPAAALTGMPSEHIEALLAHELAHIRRHDYLVNVLQRVVEAVLFYHPAVWWVSGQIRRERELCCDDLAVSASGDALSYARALADLEFSRAAHAHTAVAANGGSLVARIQRLAGQSETASHTALGPVAAITVALVVLFVAGAAVVRGAQTPARSVGVVERKSIWVDTVSRGDMALNVRGLGTLTTNSTAELRLPPSVLKDVKPGQSVSIWFPPHTDQIATGTVAGVNPGAKLGTATVQITSTLPSGVQPGSDLDGTILVGGMKDVLRVGRPAFCKPDSTGYLFRLEPDGQEALRVPVEYGRASVTEVEIRSGLAPGDKVILNDMSQFLHEDRIALK
jgi:beta-lactamase regulating signal transducer with metallopeptidase domain